MKARMMGSMKKSGFNSSQKSTQIDRVPLRYMATKRPFTDNYVCLYKKFLKEARESGLSSSAAKKQARDLANAALNKFPNMI